MGKRAIDKSKKIENKNQRSVAFCKRKRGFLKKAIELSRLCDQRIFLIMYDADKNKVIQFCSDEAFNFETAYKVVKNIKKAPNVQQNMETYTNEDYKKFELVDFRTIRYKQKLNINDESSDLNFEDDETVNEKSQQNLMAPDRDQEDKKYVNSNFCQQFLDQIQVASSCQDLSENISKSSQPSKFQKLSQQQSQIFNLDDKDQLDEFNKTATQKQQNLDAPEFKKPLNIGQKNSVKQSNDSIMTKKSDSNGSFKKKSFSMQNLCDMEKLVAQQQVMQKQRDDDQIRPISEKDVERSVDNESIEKIQENIDMRLPVDQRSESCFSEVSSKISLKKRARKQIEKKQQTPKKTKEDDNTHYTSECITQHAAKNTVGQKMNPNDVMMPKYQGSDSEQKNTQLLSQIQNQLEQQNLLSLMSLQNMQPQNQQKHNPDQQQILMQLLSVINQNNLLTNFRNTLLINQNSNPNNKNYAMSNQTQENKNSIQIQMQQFIQQNMPLSNQKQPQFTMPQTANTQQIFQQQPQEQPQLHQNIQSSTTQYNHEQYNQTIAQNHTERRNEHILESAPQMQQTSNFFMSSNGPEIGNDWINSSIHGQDNMSQHHAQLSPMQNSSYRDRESDHFNFNNY